MARKKSKFYVGYCTNCKAYHIVVNPKKIKGKLENVGGVSYA